MQKADREFQCFAGHLSSSRSYIYSVHPKNSGNARQAASLTSAPPDGQGFLLSFGTSQGAFSLKMMVLTHSGRENNSTTFPSDPQPRVSIELWGRQGFAWDNLQMIPRAMSNLPDPVLQQHQPGASGQGVLSAFSLAGAHAAASLPLEGLLGMCRGKNTLLHRHTPRQGSFCCLARLLGTICLNGGLYSICPPCWSCHPPFLPSSVPSTSCFVRT